jgi:hypothetical protein
MLKKSVVPGLVVMSLILAPALYTTASSPESGRCPGPHDSIESFSFKLSAVPFGPAANGQVFSVSLSYRYRHGLKMSEFPDDNALATLVKNFMAQYPTPSDFIEQVNRGLNAQILSSTPGVVELTSSIQKPNDGVISEPVTSTLTAAQRPCRVSGVTR